MLNNDTLDKELDAFLGADNNTPDAETKPITQGGNLDKELDAFLATDKGEEQPLMIRHLDNEPDKEVAERMRLENKMQDMAIGLGAQSLQRTKAQVKNNLHMPQQMLSNSAASVDARLAVIDDKLSNLEKKVVAESNRDAEAIPEVVSAFVPAGAIRPRDAQRFASHEALGGKAIRDARDKINSIRKNNLTSGIAEGFDWVSALTLGLNDLASGAHLNSVLKKKYEGKELTEREQLAYDIYEITQELESIQQETGGASLWNTLGKGVGFTAEVASSMPIGVGLVGSGVKMTSLGAKAGLKLTKEAFKEGVVSGLKRGLVETSKVAGRSAANIARAEAVGFLSAPITPTSWSAFIEKRNEQFKLNNGNLEYAEKAAWKDLADTWIEQANEISSEVMGSRIATVVGGAAKNFGRLIRLDKVADKIGIGAASRTFMGLRKPAYVREFEKSIGFTGFLGEPLSEFWGDVASESMKSMLTDNGDFSKIMSSDYWLQTLGVCSLYGGAVSIATVPATIAEYKKSNIYGVSKARGNALTRISDRALRNELLSISAIDDINIASKELATLPWDNYSKADIASAMDFIRADYVEKVLLGDANENKRMQMYEGVALSTSELAYRGQDGNDITEDIVSIDTDSGRYVVISGVVDANTDNMLQCMDANGNIVPIHASKIQGVFKHSLQQEMGDRYKQMFASQVEQDRQADIIDTYKDMKDPAREDVQRVMNAFGVKEHQDGESITLVDGRQGVVDSFEDDGVYIINVPTEQGAQLLSVPFYDVLAEDTTIAEAQSMNYAMRTFSDMELAMKDDLKQSTPTESVTTKGFKTTKFAVNEPVYAPNGKQAIIREINEDGTYTIDYNTNPNARLEDMQLDVVPEGDLSSGITTIEEDVVAQETPETQVEMEATPYEAEVKDIPTQEDGSVDYNAISDPKQYAELFTKDMGGVEIAATQIQKMADATRKEVEKLVTKSESLVDANEVVRNNKAIVALNDRLSFYGDVLNTLTPPQPQQKVEEDAPNPKSEKKVDVGLVANEYSEKLPKAQTEAIDKMAKLVGLSVVFVDSVEAANGAKANADIKGNEVRIAYENRDRAIDFLVGHEFTHRMQDLSPEQYAAFKESVKLFMGEEAWNTLVEHTLRNYRRQNVPITRAAVEDEVVADYVGELVNNHRAFDAYLASLDDKSLLQTILDVLRAIRDFIFNAEAEGMKDITDMIKNLDTLIASAAEAQTKGVEVKNGDSRKSLTEAEAVAIIEAMKANAEVAPQLELTPENWAAEFGANGVVATPIGEVKMGDGQYQKMQQQGRSTKLGMIKPTLTNPDVIVEEASTRKDGKEAERNSSYVFVKAFTNAEGTRDYMFTSVSNLRDGIEIVMSNQEKETPRIKRLLKEGKLAYINKATLPSEFTASAQGDQSTIPSEVSYSESKDTTSSPNMQEERTKFSLRELDAPYLDAVERGDLATAQQMVMEAAKMAGYDTDTSYQGSLAFNGAAPDANAYFETKEERKEAWNNDDYDGTMSLGDYADNAIDTNDLEWQLTDRGNYRRAEDYTKESIDNINKAIKDGSHKITIYRAVPNNVEESSVGNGDWVTPSRKYAEFHIGLQDWESGRIIEQEVDVDDIWWNGDDINEWGYDDGANYSYRNTPNNRKLLDPVTYDDAGNVIPLSERFNPKKEDIRYSLSAPTFYSNAEYAVRNIKQEKATPEQWLKMIEKAGGLKAGEDKWLSLSDWLKASKAKTLTKDEVLQHIAENDIQIEEVVYYDEGRFSSYDITESDEFSNLLTELTDYDEDENPSFNVERFRELQEQDKDFAEGFELDYWGESIEVNDPIAAARYLGLMQGNGEIIHGTRLDYTTQGLSNKREIALVVPTIEPYNAHDEIHFGDAGEGRAVAWVRFGDAEAQRSEEVVRRVDEFDAPYKDVNGHEIYRPKDRHYAKDFISYGKLKSGEYAYVVYVNDKQIPVAHKSLEDARNALNEHYKTNPEKQTRWDKVLVIDEIQSKRHQDGREKGYISAEEKAKIDAIRKQRDDLSKLRRDWDYRTGQAWRQFQSGEISEQEYNRLWDTQFDAEKKHLDEIEKNINTEVNVYDTFDKIPSAPFEKNWAELAMKRMLRYAAENGYDHVAWTTGDQQADRYDIGSVVKDIVTYDTKDADGNPIKKMKFRMNNMGTYNIATSMEGVIVKGDGEMKEGMHLSDITGKPLAEKIMKGEGEDAMVFENGKDIEAKSLEGEELHIGNEGMKAFYDQMLPSFVKKYTKKWGAEVGEVTMPDLEENNTMHAVNVTDSMRESVMQGQPRFALQDTISAEEQVHIYMQNKHLKAKQNIREKYRTARQVAKLDYNEKRAARQAKIRDMRTNSAKVEYILGEVIEATMPYEHQAYAKIARGEIKMPWETLSAEIGVKKGEKRIYAGITKGANPNNTFDSVVYQWWEELNGYENNIDTQDLRNALIDALRTAPSSTRALQELNAIYDKDSGILSNTMDDLERMEAEEISAEDARYAEEERSFNADKSAHIAAFERDAAFYSQLEVMDATVVAIREKLEKTKMGLEKRQQNRYYKGLMEAIAEVKQAVKNVISSKTIENLDRNELRRVIDKIDNARSLGDVDAIVSELENITLTAMTRHQDKDLKRMLKLRLPNGVSVEEWVGEQVKAGRMSRADADVMLRDKWKGRNASGVNIAKWVDNTTSEIMQWVAAKIGPALAKNNVIVAESEVEANNARIEELEQKAANTTNGTAMPSDRFTDADDIELKGRILYGKFLNAMSAKKSIAILQDERAEIYEHYHKLSTVLNETLDRIERIDDEKRSAEETEFNADKSAHSEAARDKHLEANMKALVEAKRQYKEAMDMANEAFATLLKEGREALSLFRREQEAHKAMIINMGCDALDINPRTVPNTPTTMEKIKAYNRAYINAPYYTFQTTLKEIDRRAPNGEGRFYNYFMNGVINCTDKFISQHSMHIEQVAENMRRILGVKEANDADVIGSVIDLSDTTPLLTVTYGGEDAVSGIMAEQKVLTLSNALYIIAMWRQPKYRDSMIYNGFTEEMYDKVYDAVLGVDEHYITFLNWVNEQLLPSTRLMYDKVHQEMFGTSMANERNYFPAKVVGYEKKEDVSVDDVGSLPSTITGAIVARVYNRNMIDLNMNYFKVLMGHLQEMDQWSSFAPITRDLNALASNTEFRNGCNALMSGLNADRGGKGSLFTNFKTTASIAVNAYRPKSTALDDLLLSVTRGWAGANITWRLSTAIKQLASSPVFAVYALDPVCIGIWAKNSAVTFATQRKTLEWAIANSPMFKKRWESKFAGMDIFNTKVNEDGGYGIYDKVADSKMGRGAKAFDDAISKFASDWGMTPNAFIDAMTVANGIKTVYEYELHRAKKQNGNKPITEKQKREAMIKAEIAFNATQQSSEGAFISEWQANRTLATRIITVYQNSAYGFHRLKVSALNELMKQLDPEYKANIIDIYGRDANKVLLDARLRAGAQLAQGIVGDLLFVLMGGAGTVPLFRIFSGGDDEGEEQALLIEAFKGAVFNITLGGFVGGNILSSLTSGYTISLGGALDNLVKDIQSALDYKIFSLPSVYYGLNIVARYRYGVDFDTLANIAMGIEGLIEGAATGEGKSEAVMKMLNVPQSQINIVAGKRRPGETIQEYITRRLRTESIGSVPEVDDEGDIKSDQEYWDSPFTPKKYYARQYKKDFDAARTRGVIFREADGDAYANYLDTEEKYNEVVKTLGWAPNATPNKKATEGGKYVAPIEGLGYEEYKEIKRLATDAARKAKKVDTFEGTDENYYKLLTEMVDAKQELINKYNEL